MSEEQEKEFDKFLDIAVKKGYNQMVCLAVAGIMLSSSNWQTTINDIIALAEECENCGDFGHKLIEQF